MKDDKYNELMSFSKTVNLNFSQLYNYINGYREEIKKRGFSEYPSILSTGTVKEFYERKFNKELNDSGYSLISSVLVWNLNKDIIRIDNEIYKSLEKTEKPKILPSSVLNKIPTYCFFVELEGYENLEGFFSRIEIDETYGDETHAYLTLDFFPDMHTAYLVLDKESTYIVGKTPNLPEKALETAINIVLYLCTEYAEWNDGEKPYYPTEVKTRKHGLKFIPASSPKFRDVGKATGDLIRESRKHDIRSGDKRPHIRKAHWHGFWTGSKKGERKLNLKWLSPIFVKGQLI